MEKISILLISLAIPFAACGMVTRNYNFVCELKLKDMENSLRKKMQKLSTKNDCIYNQISHLNNIFYSGLIQDSSHTTPDRFENEEVFHNEISEYLSESLNESIDYLQLKYNKRNLKYLILYNELTNIEKELENRK